MTHKNERGFVLATSLVLLLLMGMLTAAVFVSVESSQKSSMASESSTQAFYYAETAANYMAWALYNDADFDSYVYPSRVKLTGEFSFNEPAARSVRVGMNPDDTLVNPVASGDYKEWRANRGNPSGDQRVVKPDGTYVQYLLGKDVFGQLMYYDNDLLNRRALSLRSGQLYTFGTPKSDVDSLYKVHKQLPRYIMLSIDESGNITPSLPPYNNALPHHTDVMGVDYPENGALVWLTGGGRQDDLQIDPVDHYFAPVLTVTGGVVTYDPNGVYTGTIACNPTLALDTSIACSSTGLWLTDADYGLVIYALGYVRGRAQKLIRVVYKK